MTAGEILDEWLFQTDTTSFKEGHYFVIEEAMQEYAKLKCQELLEIVAEKARVRDVQTFEIQDPHDLGCDYRLEIYKDSILNCVDLENFCS